METTLNKCKSTIQAAEIICRRTEKLENPGLVSELLFRAAVCYCESTTAELPLQ